jgi:hypothetical protein
LREGYPSAHCRARLEKLLLLRVEVRLGVADCGLRRVLRYLAISKMSAAAEAAPPSTRKRLIPFSPERPEVSHPIDMFIRGIMLFLSR